MHKSLVNNILRGEWGWNGLVVSDWASVGETIMHGAAEDTTDAAAKCLAAGCDMDMAGGSYRRGIKKALEQGRITQAQIDEAVRRVLRLKFMLGLFDDPFKYLDRERRNNTLEKPEYRAKAREAAAKSMVLLKNDGGLLPIQPGGPFKKIAIVGPYADSRGNKDYMSFWTLGLGPGIHDYDSSKVVTPVQALKPALEAQGIEVVVVQSRLDGPEDGRYTAAMEACRDVDLIIACVGERGFDSGECRSVTDINLPKNQERMLRMVSRNGERAMVVVLFNSRPLTFPWADQNATAILNAWQPGYETGNALADILLGRANPSGRLPITFPRTLGQVPLYYNAPNTGRPQQQQGEMWKSGYLDAPNSPAYPFGFGLSYTHCSYSTPKLSTARLKRGETLNISVELTNTGKMAMEETAQCYIRDLSADIARPVKELKAFEKVKLQPGEKKTVVFRLSEKDLAYWNDALKFKADPGKFKLYVGRNARDAQELEFELLP
jgi:beta-glucosidase